MLLSAKQTYIFVGEADLYILMLDVSQLVSLPCLIKRYTIMALNLTN